MDVIRVVVEDFSNQEPAAERILRGYLWDVLLRNANFHHLFGISNERDIHPIMQVLKRGNVLEPNLAVYAPTEYKDRQPITFAFVCEKNRLQQLAISLVGLPWQHSYLGSGSLLLITVYPLTWLHPVTMKGVATLFGNIDVVFEFKVEPR